MSDNLPVLRGGFFTAKVEREAEKELERVRARAAVAAYRDRAEIVRVTGTTKQGMQAAYDICAEEALLAPSDPLVQARVRVIADAGALCIAGIVKDAGRGF
jgi:uncharacterized protein YcaQ